MLTFKDYNLELIRDFTEDQFTSHIKLIEDIHTENDFEATGVRNLLENYLKFLHGIQEEHKNGKEEFRLTQNEVLLYDLNVEIARLCYKHSYETSSSNNDWENEFE